MAETWQISAGVSTLRRLNADLLGYLRKRVAQTFDAEDLLSQTWIAAGRLFERRSSLRYYMFVIAKRMVADYWDRMRHAGRRSASSAEDCEALRTLVAPDDLDRNLIQKHGAAAILAEIEMLPPDYRKAIRLKLEGYNNHQIADILDVQYHTVRSRVARGKAQLVAALEGEL